MADFVEVTRAAGGRAYLYLPFLDEGLPRDLLYRPRGTPYPYQSRFSAAHPELVEVDRSGKERHWEVLCYSYPEVRRYRLEMLRDLLAEAPADGLHLCTCSYVLPAAYGDKFGFNRPVVEEYRRRYGVDILQSDFDLESWRRLRGEALSRFLWEVKDLLRPAGRRLSLAVPRGNHWTIEELVGSVL